MSAIRLTRRAMLGALGLSTAALVRSAPPARHMVLLDPALDPASLRQARALLGAYPPLMLEADLVWQWRRGLGALIAASGTANALLRWDKALVLSGLAREHRLPVRHQRLGRSLFSLAIG